MMGKLELFNFRTERDDPALPPYFYLFNLFRAAPVAYGGSQSRGPIGAVAADLHHSHSNAGFLTH